MLGLNNSQFHSMTKQLTLFLMLRFCTKHVIKCSVNKLMLIWPWRFAFAVHAFQMYYCWFIPCVHYVHPKASSAGILEKYLHMPTFVCLKLDISSSNVMIYIDLQTEKPPETPREFSSALLWNIVSLLHNQRKLNRLAIYWTRYYQTASRGSWCTVARPSACGGERSWLGVAPRTRKESKQSQLEFTSSTVPESRTKTQRQVPKQDWLKASPYPWVCIFIQKKQQRNKHTHTQRTSHELLYEPLVYLNLPTL